jgi:predicted nuclease of restriction endonuclease-like (RecB) superfamily
MLSQINKQQQFAEIAQFIQQSKGNVIQSINTELINLYWNIGKYISEQVKQAAWGEKTITELAEFIYKNQPETKGFNRRSLYRMKQFYETYNNHVSIVSSPMTQLQLIGNESENTLSSMAQFKMDNIRETILAKISWTHHLILISRAKTIEEREFYLRLCVKEKYSVKELERQINSSVFERTMLGNVQLPHIVKEARFDALNSFKDSYVFEFLGLPEPHNENDLQKALIHKMKNFILELGKDFLFISEEYKLQVGNNDFFIDLLFYHRSLQCLVAFELKADKFKPEHLGQLNFYLEALDRDVKKTNENPSIGILLCKDNAVVEYALSRSLSSTMVAEYKTYLPEKKILQQKLHELFE